MKRYKAGELEGLIGAGKIDLKKVLRDQICTTQDPKVNRVRQVDF